MLFAGTTSAAQADGEEDGAESPETNYIGSDLRWGESDAALFPVFKDGSQTGDPDVWAYCIESEVLANTNVDAEVSGWDGFKGNNNFKNDQDVQSKVGWIITNSYPNIDLHDLVAKTGISGLTEKQAIAGTQYAIWKLTDDREPQSLSAKAEALRGYLLGDENVGLPEKDVKPTVTLTDESDNQRAGELVGPVSVETNQDSIEIVTNDESLPIVDGEGNEVDLGTVSNGQKLYVDARDVTEAGSVQLSSSVESSQTHGSLLLVPDRKGNNSEKHHAQTIILVDNKPYKADSAVTVEWDAPLDKVTPASPQVNPAECTEDDEGETVWETVEAPEDKDGVTYSEVSVDDNHVATVTASAEDGVIFDDLGDGWEHNADGTATWTYELESEDCSGTNGETPPGEDKPKEKPSKDSSPNSPDDKSTTPAVKEKEPGGGLAETGGNHFALMGGVIALTIAGTSSLLFARRRRG
jgi:TQXA domain-containing protein